MKILCLAALVALVSSPVFAINESMLKGLEGYTLVKVGEITGWRNSKGEKSDSFNGCENGRKLIVDYSYQVTCQSYGYSYAYHPKAFFFQRGSTMKMIVENDIYDISSP